MRPLAGRRLPGDAGGGRGQGRGRGPRARRDKELSEAQEAPLREFRPRPGSSSNAAASGIGRWARFLLGLAAFQAAGALLLLWLRSSGPRDFVAAARASHDALGNGGTVESGLPANLTAFGDPSARLQGVKRRPNDIAILLITSGKRLTALRTCLRSLSHVNGFDPGSVLVSQALPGDASRRVAEAEFGVSWIGPLELNTSVVIDGAGKDASSQESMQTSFVGSAGPFNHYQRSLEHAVMEHFMRDRYQSVLVIQEDLVFSPDLLWFFAQLEPLLEKDPSLWCISAWNDNGVAPYAADLTVVLRTDWFSGIGWLVTLDALRHEILPHWKQYSVDLTWRAALRQDQASVQRQCLIPEVPRLAFSDPKCESFGRRECVDDEVSPRQLSAHVVMSSAAATNLGNVDRLRATAYENLFNKDWPHGQGLVHAHPVKSLNELEHHLGYTSLVSTQQEENEMNIARAPLILIIQVLEKDARRDKGPLELFKAPSWDAVARYFGLTRSGPRSTYFGIVRLRWRDFTLYIAEAESSLLDDVHRSRAFMNQLRVLKGADFMQRIRPNDKAFEPPPLPIPPHSLVDQAPLGASCSRYCESLGRVCVDSDLSAVASCAPPLTSTFTCKTCEAASTARRGKTAEFEALPGWNLQTDVCSTGLREPTANGAVITDCAATGSDTRRLCVCRRQRGLPPVWLASSLRHFPRDWAAPAGVSSERLRAFRAAAKNVGKAGLQVNVNQFAPPPPGKKPPHVDAPPSALAVLVIAAASQRISNRDLYDLRSTLASLSRADKFTPTRVLVARDDGLLITKQLVRGEFGIEDVELPDSRQHLDKSQRTAALYKAALNYAVVHHFADSQTIIILHEGIRVAPDMLWYFAQVDPVVRRDPSVLCASAFNDNGFAPYVADPTVVTRTDWFSGVAWLARTSLIRDEFLTKWLVAHWEQLFREPMVRRYRQCLIPEVSRAFRHRAAEPRPSPGPERHGSGHVPLLEARYKQIPLTDMPWVDIGNVDRLFDEAYKRLFMKEWPGEGLANAKPLGSLRHVVDGRANSGGPWFLLLKNSDIDSDNSWKTVASFFGLQQAVPIRGAYNGIVRLRWRNSILFIVPTSSRLATADNEWSPLSNLVQAKKKAIDPQLFLLSNPPLFLPANSEVVASQSPGTTCDEACHEQSRSCITEDLFFINSCAALASMFVCRTCEPSEGAEQPAQNADPNSPALGRCLFNTDLARYPLSCGARHANTKRLCVCRSVPRGEGDIEAGHAPSPEMSHVAPSAPLVAQATDTQDRMHTGDELPEIVSPPFDPGQVDQSVHDTHKASSADVPAFSNVVLSQFASHLETSPSNLPVLVIATGSRPTYLEKCLASLQKAEGYDANQVLVSLDGEGAEAQQVAERLGIAWVVNPSGSRQNFGNRVSKHYKSAIEYVVKQRFAGARSVVVIEEDVIASSDLLFYFAQLEPILYRDPNLLCISAWNVNGMAPYAVDPKALLRVDGFVGVAWMLLANTFTRYILPGWPTKSWDESLRQSALKNNMQCIIPEIPRIHHIGQKSLNSAIGTVAQSRRDMSMYFTAKPSLSSFDLGDLSFISPDDGYMRDFVKQLRSAELLTSLERLPKPEGSNGVVLFAGTASTQGQGSALRGVAGPPQQHGVEAWATVGSLDQKGIQGVIQNNAVPHSWRLHYRSDMPDSDRKWRAVAKFLKVFETNEPRSSYRGVTRVPWGAVSGGALFLVASSSPLIQEANLTKPLAPTEADAFVDFQPTVQLAPGATIVASEHPGDSCTSVCAFTGAMCVESDHMFINSCEALRRWHSCEKCGGSHGHDQPALVARPGSKQHGQCLYNEDPIKYPPSCDAVHPNTQRLCVCRPQYPAVGPSRASSAWELAVTAAATTATPRVEEVVNASELTKAAALSR